MTENSLSHIGVARRSGRYPWGSGEDPFQSGSDYLSGIKTLRKEGMSDNDIAKAMGISTTLFRARLSRANAEDKAAKRSQAVDLKDRGLSNVAIGKKMGLSESSVRELLKPANAEKASILKSTQDSIKKQVDERGYIDVGPGVELYAGITRTKLNTAVSALVDEGYTTHYIKVEQLGAPGNFTTIKVLAPPGTSYSEVAKNQDKIRLLNEYSEDHGRTFKAVEPPVALSSKRVSVRYGEEGGSEMDGVIELRRGVDDISLGSAKYAQVRIAVDGTHYLKGMAVYADDLPAGVDIRFNTNKKATANKLDALKTVSDDPESPFGAIVRNKFYQDKTGKTQQSVLNIVNEEGDWDQWSKTLSAQMLSKQTKPLAKQQLDLAYQNKKAEYDDIMQLTNPLVKKRLLESFADGADSSSVSLKAAAMPRQRTQVLIPIKSMKETEIYAPNFLDGERVVLVRYPHGGTFEIPELVVNNKNPDAKRIMGQARDAVGISSRVAERLSGADFDGDSVLVIPNPKGQIKTSSPLKALDGFDTRRAYPGYEGMAVITPRAKQKKMGDVSNLITDMTIKGATPDELARAVKHSMVIIDSEKHKLNWQQSQIDNGISQLKRKYQGGPNKGASTLISRSRSDERVLDRKPRSAADGGAIDIATGKKVYTQTGASYIDPKSGKTVMRTIKSTKMAEVADAFDLSSGSAMEAVYATHANRLKALANQSRLEASKTKPLPYSATAARTYANEVTSLNAKLVMSLKNAPKERQAQLVANMEVQAKVKANPGMEKSNIKKVKGVALAKARARIGAKKEKIAITPGEWEAIQAGALFPSKLDSILRNTDLDLIKQYATPKTKVGLTPSQESRAKALIAVGYPQSEVAMALGVSVSTVQTVLE